MKYIKLLLIISMIINLVLLSIWFNNQTVISECNKKILRKDSLIKVVYKQYDNHFQEIFIEKNDSIYQEVFVSNFEHNPEFVFLLSNTYFFITHRKFIQNDIDASNAEIEGIYGKPIKIENNR